MPVCVYAHTHACVCGGSGVEEAGTDMLCGKKVGGGSGISEARPLAVGAPGVASSAEGMVCAQTGILLRRNPVSHSLKQTS